VVKAAKKQRGNAAEILGSILHHANSFSILWVRAAKSIRLDGTIMPLQIINMLTGPGFKIQTSRMRQVRLINLSTLQQQCVFSLVDLFLNSVNCNVREQIKPCEAKVVFWQNAVFEKIAFLWIFYKKVVKNIYFWSFSKNFSIFFFFEVVRTLYQKFKTIQPQIFEI